MSDKLKWTTSIKCQGKVMVITCCQRSFNASWHWFYKWNSTEGMAQINPKDPHFVFWSSWDLVTAVALAVIHILFILIKSFID